MTGDVHMRRPVAVGIMLPTSGAADCGRYDVIAAARLAEELGFDSIWTVDHLAFHSGILEPVSVLAAASGVTERVALGFGVLLVAMRQPAWTAKQIASLQVLSGDRVVLGVGVGGENPDEWVAAGVPVVQRGMRTDAFLDVLPALVTGVTTRLPGPWGVTVPALAPTGAVPPVWVGGRSAAAIERAARRADGWLGLWVDAEQLSRRRGALSTRARELGRPEPHAGVTVVVNVDDRDPDHAMAEVTRFLHSQYARPAERFLRYVIAGTSAEVADGLASLVEAGADQLVLLPGAADYPTQYRRLASLLHNELSGRQVGVGASLGGDGEGS